MYRECQWCLFELCMKQYSRIHTASYNNFRASRKNSFVPCGLLLLFCFADWCLLHVARDAHSSSQTSTYNFALHGYSLLHQNKCGFCLFRIWPGDFRWTLPLKFCWINNNLVYLHIVHQLHLCTPPHSVDECSLSKNRYWTSLHHPTLFCAGEWWCR